MRDDEVVVLVHLNGTRERIRNFHADTEKVSYNGRWYRYVGTQESERIYKEEPTGD